MELKPGYKQTEVGVIPEDWNVVNIGEVSKTSSGTTPARSQRERYFRDGEFHWIKTMDLNNSLIEDTEEKVTALALKETCLQIYPIGTVLVAMYGGFNQIGRTGLLGIAASVNQALVAIQLERKKVEPRFLLNTLNYRVEYWKSVASSSRKDPNITSNDVKYFKFPLPPTKTEQTAIANALSDADALIQSLTRLIAKKRQIKQGAMQTLLNPYENGRLKEGWVVKKLGEAADIDPENLNASVNPNYKFKYISLEDVDRGVLRNYSDQIFATAPSRARRIVKKGDILFGTVRPNLQSHCLIKNHVEDLVCSTGFAVIRCRDNIANPPYIFSLFFAEFVEKQIQTLLAGSNYPAINSSDVRKLDIPLPQMDEQTHIAKILSDMDAEIAALETKLAKYQHIKQGMMQNLLTGRIRLL